MATGQHLLAGVWKRWETSVGRQSDAYPAALRSEVAEGIVCLWGEKRSRAYLRDREGGLSVGRKVGPLGYRGIGPPGATKKKSPVPQLLCQVFYPSNRKKTRTRCQSDHVGAVSMRQPSNSKVWRGARNKDTLWPQRASPSCQDYLVWDNSATPVRMSADSSPKDNLDGLWAPGLRATWRAPSQLSLR